METCLKVNKCRATCSPSFPHRRIYRHANLNNTRANAILQRALDTVPVKNFQDTWSLPGRTRRYLTVPFSFLSRSSGVPTLEHTETDELPCRLTSGSKGLAMSSPTLRTRLHHKVKNSQLTVVKSKGRDSTKEWLDGDPPIIRVIWSNQTAVRTCVTSPLRPAEAKLNIGVSMGCPARCSQRKFH